MASYRRNVSIYISGAFRNEPLSPAASTATALFCPIAVMRVPSIGSTAISTPSPPQPTPQPRTPPTPQPRTPPTPQPRTPPTPQPRTSPTPQPRTPPTPQPRTPPTPQPRTPLVQIEPSRTSPTQIESPTMPPTQIEPSRTPYIEPPVFKPVKPVASVNDLLKIMDTVKPYIYDDIAQLEKANQQIMVSLGM